MDSSNPIELPSPQTKPMHYIKPVEVLSPKRYLESVEEIYDGKVDAKNSEKSYSLAKVRWQGKEQLAIRWNVSERELENKEKLNGEKRCVGMPASHGYPVWFVLPQELLDKNSDAYKALEKALSELKNSSEVIPENNLIVNIPETK